MTHIILEEMARANMSEEACMFVGGMLTELDRLQSEVERLNNYNAIVLGSEREAIKRASASQRRVGELEDLVEKAFGDGFAIGRVTAFDLGKAWDTSYTKRSLQALSPEVSPSLGERKSLEIQQKD